ncbi:MAG TPA: hypothetical protein VFU11_08720, partial [Solirubrobacterales bacterium]|nr:hypothetical protein [Solirubrobacterales bacterium]
VATRRRNLPAVSLGVALVAASIILAKAQWDVTFFQDTWAFLLDRQDFSADAFLQPHNEHIVVIPVAITKVLLEVFGMTSNTPEQVAMGLTLLAAAVLLFVYVRRRTNPWLALMAASLMLFLGSAWPILLWPFENEFTLPIVFGLAMLLFLDREDGGGDAWACAMLVLAVLSGSLGISFVLAAAVDVFVKRGTRGWRRAYVFLVPGLVYLAWYAGWGHEAETHLTLANVLNSPVYVMEGFASALGSLAGLSSTPAVGPASLQFGSPLLVAALVAAGLRIRQRGVPASFWPVAAAGVSYWLLAAFNFIPGREAASTRYVYAGALFILLMATELLRGVRWTRNALLVASGVVIVAIIANIGYLRTGGNWLREQSIFTRADLAALEISRRTVNRDFPLAPYEVAGTASLAVITAGKYFEAVDRWGSPAYSIQELEAAPAAGRHYADVVLSRALPLETEVLAGRAQSVGSDCITQGGGATGEVELGPGLHRIVLPPGPAAVFKLRRFATDEYPVATEPSPGGSTTLLRIPTDAAANPWHLHVEASQGAEVCLA